MKRLAAVLIACLTVPASARACDPGGGQYILRTEALAAALSSVPSPIEPGEPFDLVFTLCSRLGFVTEVRVDARMPAHRHGMNYRPRVSAQPDGGFRAVGLLFHMTGQWEILIEASVAGRSERIALPLDIR